MVDTTEQKTLSWSAILGVAVLAAAATWVLSDRLGVVILMPLVIVGVGAGLRAFANGSAD